MIKSSWFIPLVGFLLHIKANAFAPNSQIRNQLPGRKGSRLFETSSSTDLAQVTSQFDLYLRDGQLRSAVRLLRNHPDLEISRTRWNDIFSAIEERTLHAEENTENLRRQMEFPTASAARSEMSDMYRVLKEQNHLKLYGAMDTKLPLAAGKYDLPPKLLESILNLPMTALTPEPTNTMLWAGGAVAIAEGLLAFSTGISLNFLVFLTVFFAVLDRAFLNGAGFESFVKLFSPGIQTKILRHEAGHFLAAYVLGCPVEGIVLSAWAALQDRRFGSRQVSAGTSFFDPQLSEQINGNQNVSRSAVDRYSIIVMAGIAAEAEFYKRADGGAGDEMALVAFLSRLNASGKWNADAIRNQARWGALQAVLLLREYQPAYQALVDALERGGTLGDCIHAIEQAAREHNLGPVTQPLGYIVGPNGLEEWTTNPPPDQQRQEKIETKKEFDQDESLLELQRLRAELEDRRKEIRSKLDQIEEE